MSLDNLPEMITTLSDRLTKYREKPTKAESKRIRDSLNEFRKAAPFIRAELVDLDKKGY